MSDTPPQLPPPPPPPGYNAPPGYGYPPPGYGQQPGYGFPPPGYGYPPPGCGYVAPLHATRLGYRTAGFFERLAAYIIDGLVVFACLLPIFIVAVIIGATSYESRSGVCTDSSGYDYNCNVPTDSTIGIILLLAGACLVASLLVALLYWGKLEGERTQTVGKRAMGIRTIDQNTGAPIGFGRAVGRLFARIISQQVFALGYLWMLWDDQKQTWHDKIVKSIVVKA